MKSILVPVNFSSCSANAVHYAAELAMATGAGLHLLHVIQVPLPSTEMTITESLFNQMWESADEALKEIQEDVRKRTGGRLSVQTHLDTGGVAGKVEDLLKTLRADLIVMGVTGPTMEKFLAGSAVNALLHLRHPILVVPEHAEYKPYRLIALACDEKDINCGIPHSLPLLRELKERYGAAVDVITVETSEVMSDEACGYPPEASESLALLNPVRRYVRRPSIEEGLEVYLEAHGADLAVVFPKKHALLAFHQSRSRHLAKNAAMPVLILPE